MAGAQSFAAAPPPRGQLLRVLGLAFAVAVGLGSVIGGGILRTPASVMDVVPHAGVALALWIAVGIHALLQGNVVCELMTAIPKSGGMLVPARAAFGAPGGLLVGWSDWLSYVAACGALSVLLAEFVAIIVPGAAGMTVPLAVGVLLLLTALNWLGVREGSRFQIVGSAAKALFLIGIVLLILLSPAPDGAKAVERVSGPLTFAGIIIAYQTIVGAYAGWNLPAYFAEEDRDPGRNIPRGIFSTILLVVALYSLVTIALTAALPLEVMRRSNLPIADAIAPLFGDLSGKLVAAGAVLIVLTSLNAQIMGAPRILYGLASARLFPAAALRVNRGGTPVVGLALSAAVAVGLAFTGQFETIFLIMAAFGFVTFLVADLALFKLRRTAPDLPRPYRAKLYPWLPGLVLVLDATLLTAFLLSDSMSGVFIVAAVAIAVPIGLLMRRAHGSDAFGQDAGQEPPR